MPQEFEHRPQARLALSRAQSGLVRARHGWASEDADIDRRDLVNFRTVKALAARGLIVIEDNGSRARLINNPEEN
jgi:hypothetical protein